MAVESLPNLVYGRSWRAALDEEGVPNRADEFALNQNVVYKRNCNNGYNKNLEMTNDQVSSLQGE